MTKIIVLTNDRSDMLVSKVDYAYLRQWTWYFQEPGYAKRMIYSKGKRTSKYAHRDIMEQILGHPIPEGMEVDHIDGNGLNNARGNIRIATRMQNQVNTPKHKGQSRFKGVSWSAERNKWAAYIAANHKSIFLGRYESERQAARAYDAAARHFFGEFAWLNFPDEIIPYSEVTERIRRIRKTSKYRGVRKHGQCRGWQARIHVRGKQMHLGMFADEPDAARAYDEAALKYFGESAKLNFPQI